MSDTHNQKDREIQKVRDYDFILKKSSNLASVLYKITEFLSDNEPIKWQLRGESSELAHGLAINHYGSQDNASEALYRTLNKISGILTLCGISANASYLSEMNFSVIKSEYENLRSSIIAYYGGEDRTDLVTFQSPAMLLGFLEEDESYLSQEIRDFKGQEKDIKDINMSYKNTADQDHKISTSARDHKKDSKKSPRPSSNTSRRDKGSSVRLDTPRRSSILGFLKKNDEVAIGDIKEVVPDCSEKTIQRELAFLVDKGLVKRTGERRWARYSLA